MRQGIFKDVSRTLHPPLNMNHIFFSPLCPSLSLPLFPNTNYALYSFISCYHSNPTSKLCPLNLLTSKHSQHLFQIWGSKHTLQLGGESFWLLQSAELTPGEMRPHEPPTRLTLGPSSICVSLNSQAHWRASMLFLKKITMVLQRTLAGDPEDLD